MNDRFPRRAGAAVCAAVAVALGTLTPVGPLAAPPAAAEPSTAAEPGDPGTPGIGSPLGGQAPNRVRMRVDRMQPRVVDASSRFVEVSGVLRNVGDRRLSDVRVRLQLGERISDPTALQAALLNPPLTDVAYSEFVPVRDSLRPQELVPFRVRVPIGSEPGALPLPERGVYPLLLNVNGTPSYGGQARVGSLDLLLPVRGPGGARTGRPAELTMLWPLVDDRPRRVGTQGRFEVLSDDTLATSLAPGGRLAGLVDAASAAVRNNAQLSDALCVAIDPDLVRTAAAMRDGYRIRDGARPGATRPGRGARAAADWLNRLNGLLSGRCVISLPYADADLVALARRGLPDLERAAVSSSGVLTSALPGARPLRGVVWPAGGSLDQRTAADLAGGSSLIMDPNAIGRSDAPGPLPLERTGEADQQAIRLDRLTSTALGGSSVERGRSSGVRMPSQTPQDTESVAVQNGLAALLYRTEFAGPGSNPSVLVAPPRRWHAPQRELTVLLDTVSALLDGGQASPTRLQDLVDAPQAGRPVSVNYPPAVAAIEVPRAATEEIARDNGVRRDLLGAMHRDPSQDAEPADVVEPVQQALLRASSSAWRGVGRDGAVSAARDASNQLLGLTSLVSVQRTNLPLTLASDDSRLRLTVDNGLRVAMDVRLKLINANGLRVDRDITMNLPAGLAVSRDIPVKVLRSGRFTVDVALTTNNGTPLGRPARIELASTAYGGVTLGVAGTAFAALLLLSGRRIYRRVRNGKPAADDRPDPPAAATGAGTVSREPL